MDEPSPIEGYEWVRAADLRDRLSEKEVRGLYQMIRPRDRVVDRKRWVAVPAGYGGSGA